MNEKGEEEVVAAVVSWTFYHSHGTRGLSLPLRRSTAITTLKTASHFTTATTVSFPTTLHSSTAPLSLSLMPRHHRCCREWDLGSPMARCQLERHFVKWLAAAQGSRLHSC